MAADVIFFENRLSSGDGAGRLRGQICDFLWMCSLLSDTPATDDFSWGSFLHQLQIEMYETKRNWSHPSLCLLILCVIKELQKIRQRQSIKWKRNSFFSLRQVMQKQRGLTSILKWKEFCVTQNCYCQNSDDLLSGTNCMGKFTGRIFSLGTTPPTSTIHWNWRLMAKQCEANVWYTHDTTHLPITIKHNLKNVKNANLNKKKCQLKTCTVVITTNHNIIHWKNILDTKL